MSGRQFRVAARAPASTLIPEGERIEVTYEVDGRPIKLIFRTRYLDQGHFSKVPADLWLDATGEAADLTSAAWAFSNAGRDMAMILSLSANAAIAPLEPEIIFETTPGLDRREHFQRYLAPDGFAYASRRIDSEAAIALIGAIGVSTEKDRLIRATSQYSEALQTWRGGHELLALSHLFMGVEAIKTAYLRWELDRTGKDRDQLAADWGFEAKRRMQRDTFLDQQARLRLVFQGEEECHRVAKETSDQYEHGFKNAGMLHAPAGECLVRTAELLRQAIFTVANLPQDAMRTLLGPNYLQPRGPTGVETYVRSTIVGTGEALAALGSEYPHYEWASRLKDVRHDAETGLYTFQPDHSMTASIAEGVSFTFNSVEAYDRSIFAPFARPAGNEED